MKLLFIRHGDPDYVKDSLTEKGWREAKLLSERMKNIKADRIFVSPLGRAKDTASLSLKKMGMEGKEETFPWLQEFPVRVKRPDKGGELKVAWDWLPQDFADHDAFFNPDTWMNHPVYDESDIRKEVAYIYENFEKLLNELGYKKEGRYFKAVKPNNDTLVFFCHFGLETLLLSHLLSISPMILWQGFIAAPTSVTIVATEERMEGKAAFRCICYGDNSHLYAAGVKPGLSGRFCECYTNADERHS